MSLEEVENSPGISELNESTLFYYNSHNFCSCIFSLLDVYAALSLCWESIRNCGPRQLYACDLCGPYFTRFEFPFTEVCLKLSSEINCASEFDVRLFVLLVPNAPPTTKA
ncbi:hypothetical protein PROFUN_02473 [Planoprotostelium fungivorum]|uniref:Uncharacterized protein n=1 Tax=Planoprotostelium fungivorum TaxID=1890364 RepID=A0A2P6MP14_9EUKA|nr:hypothetical protein PROFUN_02473 [Planoprotostelium fungivorum]